MKVFDSIMEGLEEAVTLKQIQELFRGVQLSKVRELAVAYREDRVLILVSCNGCRHAGKPWACDNCSGDRLLKHRTSYFEARE
jgi:hypothetical protein